MNKYKQEILSANKWIVDKGLVELTWGNVSFYDSSQGLVYIKPSGVKLEATHPQDISCLDCGGTLVSGLKASVDTPTHIKIYENFDGVHSVVHTHSKYATIFAQSGIGIPCLGTTHSDYFYGTIPCVPHPKGVQIEESYEESTGQIICDYYRKSHINPLRVQACLVSGHGPFVWGTTIKSALENAYVLEVIAEFAYKTIVLNPNAHLAENIMNKHFFRKHGSKKYYGQ